MMTNNKSEQPSWAEPACDEKGMTQWNWRVTHVDNFSLGNNTQVGSFTMIDAQEGVDIEDNVLIGFSCVILSYSSIDNRGGKVILRRGCKIGSNSVIMPGVEIGENAVVGANSFVNHNIPANELWFGSPAKFIKSL